ncbi:VOC family protein [Nonomuraea sp. NBC_01738]|uniref:VOC family protein n=1 Tax=Nonomuraea sp. NBC_01738 TaxID=2976003 RepID=UPI002E130468|nr:VOC family protein [Nonomuraea sp. NBC_01738]
MSVRNGYDSGVPCWIDLSTTDVAGAREFYGTLFGWTAEMVDDPAAGGYGQFHYEGKKVAGLGPTFTPGSPPVWNVYVATDDAAATADRAKNAGGTIVVDPMAVFGEGTMAVFQGPDSAFLSVWQAGNHTGAELVNEPNSFTWNELVTRDIGAATEFLSTVFGWTPMTEAMGEMEYTTWMNDGKPIAGMMTMPDAVPGEVPSHWTTYIAVADLDATMANARELGANVIFDRMDAPPGPFGQFIDPQGASLAVIQLHEIS